MALKDESQPVICVRTGYDLKPRHVQCMYKLGKPRNLPSSTNSSIRMVVSGKGRVALT
jgi:hypothetical protein